MITRVLTRSLRGRGVRSGGAWCRRTRPRSPRASPRPPAVHTEPVDWPLAIDTPLGPLVVTLTCGTEQAGVPDEESTLESGALVAKWRDVAGVMVDLLLTPYDGARAVPKGWAVPECWGMEWRFHAHGSWTPPMALSALLPQGTGATYDADEDMIMAEAWTDDWRLGVGGADEVWFARQVKHASLAPSWGHVFSAGGAAGSRRPWSVADGTWSDLVLAGSGERRERHVVGCLGLVPGRCGQRGRCAELRRRGEPRIPPRSCTGLERNARPTGGGPHCRAAWRSGAGRRPRRAGSAGPRVEWSGRRAA